MHRAGDGGSIFAGFAGHRGYVDRAAHNVHRENDARSTVHGFDHVPECQTARAVHASADSILSHNERVPGS
jgi:hypothetical protein